jgi:phosphohistidine swiveling domain-containing protein
MSFVNLGTRNKGTFWEYLCAYSFRVAEFPGSKFFIKKFLSAGQGMANKHCHDSIDIKKNSKIFITEFENSLYDEAYFKKLIHGYSAGLKAVKKICLNKKFNLFSNEELADSYTKVFQALSLPNPPMLQALYTLYLNDFFDQQLLKALKKGERKDEKLVNETRSFLLTNIELSITDKEEAALYNLRKLYFENFKNKGVKKFFNDFEMKQKIKKLADDYGWFHMEYAQKPFFYKDYEKHLRETIDDAGIRQSPLKMKAEIKKMKRAFFAGHPRSKYLFRLTDVLQKFAFVLDHSKAVVVYERFLASPLFKEISKRLDVSEDELLFLVPPETIDYLIAGKKADKKLIARREKNRVVLLKKDKITWFGGKEAGAIIKKYFSEEKVKKIKFLKGISAYPGKVVGKAVIVKSIFDRQKFKKGDILVTHDGSAELTVFLKEAGAIVNNEGGIICHAAIVAREMKTPCIVGTKSATKFIKDGDLIEVDSDSGIVRKLKNKKRL